MVYADRYRIGLGSARAIWALVTGAGALFGAWIAVALFPEVRFATNPTGQFHPAMIGMAALVGFGFGLAQCILLWLWRIEGFGAGRLLAWLVLTTLTIAGMIFPLWWADAEVLIMAPSFGATLMAPGIIGLAVVQGFLVQRYVRGGDWFKWTLVGGLAGAMFGLYLSAFLAYVIPGEAAWAGTVAVILAALQPISRPIPAQEP